MKNWRTIVLMSLAIVVSFYTTSEVMAQETYRSAEEVSGLEIGDKVKNFKATDQKGDQFNLKKTLAKGPVVVVFYRGQWCPICNRHLAQLQDSLRLVTEKGGYLVAVSPEKPEYLVQTKKKTGAEFTLLHDEDYAISDLFEVTFKPDEETIVMLRDMLDADLKAAHSDDTQRLPVPATFIIDQNREIVWRQVDPDYRNRSSVKEILHNLPN